ncbi:MAG: CRISPR-associated endonuclease Cas2 [Actinobacteria bacterium]|nr:CRISPR-associated endonuclease Cas2 [Actinomycetota bacterium]
MSRRRYLVAYDISDPVRLRKVHDVVKGYGYSLQYSVFVCDLGEVEKLWLKGDLGKVMHFGEDRVAIVDLGDAERRGMDCFEFMGVTPQLPRPGGPHIV